MKNNNIFSQFQSTGHSHGLSRFLIGVKNITEGVKNIAFVLCALTVPDGYRRGIKRYSSKTSCSVLNSLRQARSWLYSISMILYIVKKVEGIKWEMWPFSTPLHVSYREEKKKSSQKKCKWKDCNWGTQNSSSQIKLWDSSCSYKNIKKFRSIQGTITFLQVACYN